MQRSWVQTLLPAIFLPSLFWSFLCLHVCMFACACPPQDSLLQVPPSGGTLSVSHRHTYPLNPSPVLSTPSPKQPAPDKETNKSQSNKYHTYINTTTVGGRGGTWGLCIPVVIAPSRRARRGGFGKWTSVTPRGRKPIFPHPWLLSSKQSSGVCVGGGGTVVRSGGGGGQGDGGGGGYLCFKHTTLCSAEG